MRAMYSTYKEALTKTFFAEAVSMNTIMTGMIPTMVLLTPMLTNSMDPLYPSFWFRMSIATLVGCLLGYPANYFLVKYNLKHGCMTKKSEPSSSVSQPQNNDSYHDEFQHKHNHQKEHQQMNTLRLSQQIFYITFTFLIMLLVSFLAIYN